MGFFYFIGSCGAENWDYEGLSVELLNLVGKGYVIDHCVSLFNKKMKEMQYKVYLTDALKLINDNLVKLVGGDVMRERYYDAIKEDKGPQKTGDEIARDVIKRAGLKVKKE